MTLGPEINYMRKTTTNRVKSFRFNILVQNYTYLTQRSIHVITSQSL